MKIDWMMIITILGLLGTSSIPFSIIIYKVLDYSLNKKYVSKNELDRQLEIYVTLDRLHKEIRILETGIEKYTDKMEDHLSRISEKIENSMRGVHERIDKIFEKLSK